MHSAMNIRLILATVLLFAMFTLMIGCGSIEGEINPNIPPTVRLTPVPADSSEFTFAPTVSWFGNDEDGYVEYYSFADITDSAAIANPVEFYNRIPEDAWIDTIATQATIYLLTEGDSQTPHIFYIRCFDNKGEVNDGVVYATFFRMNNAPTIPRVGPSGVSDSELSNHFVITDTVFSGERFTSAWSGHQFQWRGSDPDDRSLYTIPLQYQPILVKSPDDTIFVGDWNQNQNLTLIDLETGFYTLYIRVRDDGFKESVAPGRIEFNVIKPSFEKDVLLIMEMGQVLPFNTLPQPDSIEAFYAKLFNDINGAVPLADLDPNSENVDFFPVYASDLTLPPRSSVHKYKVVILVQDQVQHQNYGQGQGGPGYKYYRNKLFLDYLAVGGRLWMSGRMMAPFVLPSHTIPTGGFDPMGILLPDFFSVNSVVSGQPYSVSQMNAYAEFVGTQPGVEEFPELSFDYNKIDENFARNPLTDSIYVDTLQRGLTGVDRISRGQMATTTQYFKSFTNEYDGRITGEDSGVISNLTIQTAQGPQLVNIKPTPIQCNIQTAHLNVDAGREIVVRNTTLQENGEANWLGEVVQVNSDYIKVSYLWGTPWKDSDVLSVDYYYDPLSSMHLTPVEVRFERTEYVNLIQQTLLSRTAMSTFSYYFMEYDGTKLAWTEMLNWFLSPTLNN